MGGNGVSLEFFRLNERGFVLSGAMEVGDTQNRFYMGAMLWFRRMAWAQSAGRRFRHGKVEDGYWYSDEFMGEGSLGKTKMEEEQAERSEAYELQNRICP